MRRVKFRQATPMDAKQVAPLVIEANGDISNRLTGEVEPWKIEEEMAVLIRRDDNPHSHLYTYIAEIDGKTVGVLVAYSGQDAVQLDKNLNAWLAQKEASFEEIDPESLPDEFYVDTICILPEFRGQGIGTQFFAYAEELAKQQQFSKVSLNVETQKEAAIRLYERLGFQIHSPWTIIGEPFHHMIKII